MSTNVNVTGSAEYQLLFHILNFFEERYLKEDNSQQGKLVKQLRQHLNANGAKGAMYKMVDAKYAEDFEKNLLERKIPHVKFWDTKNNAIFIIRDIDKEKFESMQKDIFSLYPEYYSQVTVDEICTAAEKNGHNDVIELSCDTADMFGVIKDKIYQEGSGIVCAPGRTPDDLGISEKGYKVFITPGSTYKSHQNDLSTMQLEMAFLSSKGDLLDLRQDQAEYDRNETAIVISELKKGRSVAIVDQLNNSNYYLTISGKTARVFERDVRSNQWVQGSTFDVPDLSDPVQASRFQRTLQTHAQRIKNMRAMTDQDFADHMKKTKTELEAEIKSSPKYLYNVTNNSLDVVKNYYPQKEGEADDAYEKRIQSLMPQFERDRHDIEKKDRPYRPDIAHSTASEKDINKHKLYSVQGKKLIRAIDEEAHRRVEAIPGSSHMTPIQKYNRVVAETKDILKKRSLPEFEQFLKGNGSYSREDAENWLKEATDFYEHPERNQFGSFQISSRSTKDVRKHERSEQTHDQDYGQSKTEGETDEKQRA